MGNIHFKEFVEVLNTLEPNLNKGGDEIAEAIEFTGFDNFLYSIGGNVSLCLKVTKLLMRLEKGGVEL